MDVGGIYPYMLNVSINILRVKRMKKLLVPFIFSPILFMITLIINTASIGERLEDHQRKSLPQKQVINNKDVHG